MRTLAGPGSEVHFTHLSQACSDSLLKSFGQVSTEAQTAEVFLPHQGRPGLDKGHRSVLGPSLSPRSQGGT